MLLFEGPAKRGSFFTTCHSYSFKSFLSYCSSALGMSAEGHGRHFERGETGKLPLAGLHPLQWQLMEHNSGQDPAELGKFQQTWC